MYMYKIIYYGIIITILNANIGNSLETDDISIIPYINITEIGNDQETLHIVFSTECGNSYFSYQALALMYTYNEVGQHDKITRLISCNPDEYYTISDEDMEIVEDTLIVPSWTNHPYLNDTYQAYNRIIGLIHWLAKYQPEAEWTLVLDPDELFIEEFKLEYFDIPEGWAQAAYTDILKNGTTNEMAQKYLPNNKPMYDTYGGNSGRLADSASHFVLIRTKDLGKILPDWLSITEEVRLDEHIYEYNADPLLKPNERSWISEMYGLVFSAAKNGLRFKADPTVQGYPAYNLHDYSLLLHYAFNHSVGDFYFDKHEHFEFKTFMCPSENASSENLDFGFFPRPPHPDDLNLSENVHKRYGELLTIHFVNTLNLALCERHKSNCPQSDIIEDECTMAYDIDTAIKQKVNEISVCQDEHELCDVVVKDDLCEEQWIATSEYCRVSCNFCRKRQQNDNDMIEYDEIKYNLINEYKVSRHGDTNEHKDKMQEKYIQTIQDEMYDVIEHGKNPFDDKSKTGEIEKLENKNEPEIKTKFIRFGDMELGDLTEQEKHWQLIQYKNSYLMFVMLFLVLIYGLVKMTAPNSTSHRRFTRRFGNTHINHEH